MECFVRASRLLDGAAAGVRAVDLWNDRLRVTVYPDRGMDVGPLFWRGLQLTWESGTDPVNPALVDTAGKGWGKGFHGGLAATCGLENVGPPCDDEGLAYGQHGTLSYTPAATVGWSAGEAWGEVPCPGGLLFRRLVQVVGDSVVIRDVVKNPTPREVPWMIQYHMNWGSPLLSPEAEVLIPPGNPHPRDQRSADGLATWDRVDAPAAGYVEQVFRHTQASDARGNARCALINQPLGLGVVLTYPTATLPYLWQWRVFDTGRYVLAFEPSNCLVKPRSRARAEGALPVLAPFSTVAMTLQVQVIEGVKALRRPLAAT